MSNGLLVITIEPAFQSPTAAVNATFSPLVLSDTSDCSLAMLPASVLDPRTLIKLAPEPV